MATYQLYGIPNCDTVKKARKQLEELEIDYEFINFKKAPPSATLIKRWKSFFGDWPVNTRGRTYQQVKEEFLSGDNNSRLSLIINNTSLIKRPILEKDGQTLQMGFTKGVYDTLV